MEIERKAIELKFPDDRPEGSVVALFSRFNVIDRDGDVTLPGAFQDGAPVRISAWGHRWDQLPVGKGRIVVTEDGAYLDGQFFLNTEAGKETYLTVKNLGELQEWSYGFEVVEAEPGEFEGKPVRFLKRLRVFEVSPVLVGAGIGTQTLVLKGMKAISDEEWSAIERELRDMPMVDLVATHRRLHQWAAQGNVLSGFTRADMERLHRMAEAELRRRAEEDDREPPEPTPLEWGSARAAEDGEEKHLPRTVQRIIERAREEEDEDERRRRRSDQEGDAKAAQLSHSEIWQLLDAAVQERHPGAPRLWLVDVYPNYAVYQIEEGGKLVYYRVDYAVVDGQAMLGRSVPVERRVEYVPLEQAGSAAIRALLVEAKEGRVLSTANWNRLARWVQALKEAISDLEELLETTKPPEREAEKRAKQELRRYAEFLRLRAESLGVRSLRSLRSSQ